MIFWGSESATVPLDDAGTRECPACQRACPFSLSLCYRFAHVYYFFGIVTSRHFLLVCGRCGNAWPTPVEKIPDGKLLARKSVPFMRRWGCLVFLLLASGAITAAIVQVNTERALREQQKQRPPKIQVPAGGENRQPP